MSAAISAYNANEGRKERKRAERKANRIEREEKARQARIEAAAEKERLAENEKARQRLKRRGYAGTVLGGRNLSGEKEDMFGTLLGSVR